MPSFPLSATPAAAPGLPRSAGQEVRQAPVHADVPLPLTSWPYQYRVIPLPVSSTYPIFVFSTVSMVFAGIMGAPCAVVIGEGGAGEDAVILGVPEVVAVAP